MSNDRKFSELSETSFWKIIRFGYKLLQFFMVQKGPFPAATTVKRGQHKPHPKIFKKYEK